MTTQVYKFGTGSLYGASTSGTAPTTPLRFGALQDVSVGFQFTNKELYGQSVFPLAVARGQGKVTGKASFAQVVGHVYNDLFFGMSLSTSGLSLNVGEAHNVPASSPYTITVTNSVTEVDDLGVVYTAGNVPFMKVTGTPAVGEYSYAAGVYTFAAADAGIAVQISYTNSVAASGVTLPIVNQLQGQAPTFSLWFATTYNGQQAMYKLNQCVASKLSMPSKMADWNIDELDFDAFADSSGNIGEIALPY